MDPLLKATEMLTGEVDLLARTNDFIGQLGLKASLAQKDEERIEIEIVRTKYILGFYRPDQSFYLQEAHYIPGTRWEPPDCDLIDIGTYTNLLDLFRELGRRLVEEALSNLRS